MRGVSFRAAGGAERTEEAGGRDEVPSCCGSGKEFGKQG